MPCSSCGKKRVMPTGWGLSADDRKTLTQNVSEETPVAATAEETPVAATAETKTRKTTKTAAK